MTRIIWFSFLLYTVKSTYYPNYPQENIFPIDSRQFYFLSHGTFGQSAIGQHNFWGNTHLSNNFHLAQFDGNMNTYNKYKWNFPQCIGSMHEIMVQHIEIQYKPGCYCIWPCCRKLFLSSLRPWQYHHIYQCRVSGKFYNCMITHGSLLQIFLPEGRRFCVWPHFYKHTERLVEHQWKVIFEKLGRFWVSLLHDIHPVLQYFLSAPSVFFFISFLDSFGQLSREPSAIGSSKLFVPRNSASERNKHKIEKIFPHGLFYYDRTFLSPNLRILNFEVLFGSIYELQFVEFYRNLRNKLELLSVTHNDDTISYFNLCSKGSEDGRHCFPDLFLLSHTYWHYHSLSNILLGYFLYTTLLRLFLRALHMEVCIPENIRVPLFRLDVFV
ncbi:hypothetical protein ACH3XW_5920 [Acanthocheilonema viteae]